MAPSSDLEIFGVLNTYILPISRNIGGAIVPQAPLVSAPLKYIWTIGGTLTQVTFHTNNMEIIASKGFVIMIVETCAVVLL